MSKLHLKISEEEETVFQLKSKDFFRLPLKQIGKSIYELKKHYMVKDGVNIIPIECTPHLSEIRDSFLRLVEDDSFLYNNNIVTRSMIQRTDKEGRGVPSFIVFMDSLALTMDLVIPKRPNDVQCDILLMICGQPVIVLTLVDGDKDSKTVVKYNTSVGRGITTHLRKFMDDNINIVCGVIRLQDLETMDTLKTAISSITAKSAVLVPSNSLTTSPSKYEKIVTAFWAGVAQTKSVISKDGQLETNYLRFLTKDQCIILLENINTREVSVTFQAGTGATTLMVEVARRLSRLEDTLFVCTSLEEAEKLRSVFPNTKAVGRLRLSDLSQYMNIVDASGEITEHAVGRLWRFSKVYTETDIEDLKQRLEGLKKEADHTQKIIYLLSYDDRQRKMIHLANEIESLKLLDIDFEGLLLAHYGLNEGKDRYRHVLDQLKRRIEERRDIFPLVAYMNRQLKVLWPYLEVTRDYLLQATSGTSQFNTEDEGTMTPQEAKPGAPQELVEEHTASEDVTELTKILQTLIKEVGGKREELRKLTDATDYRDEWENNMNYLTRELAALKIQVLITDVIGEDIFTAEEKIKTSDDDHRSWSSETRRCWLPQLRQFQFGSVSKRALMNIVGEMTTDDQRRLSILQTEIDNLERAYGSPVYIAGEIDTDRWFPLTCPELSFDKQRVNWQLAVEGDTDRELVNTWEKITGQHNHKDKFQKYQGTCSSPIPVPPFPSSPNIATYWETHTRLLVKVKGDVPVWDPLLEMGVVEEGQLDTNQWVSDQSRSWAVRFGWCYKHKAICTQVWKEKRQVGTCEFDTMSNIPEKYFTQKYGVVLDMGRGRLAFIDVNRGKLLHKSDFKCRQSLYPVFSVGPHRCPTKMKLVCCREINLTDTTKTLIAEALSSK